MSEQQSLYLYEPSLVLPSVSAAFIGISLLYHAYQNFYYRYWRVTFFMVYGGLVFTTGWIMRALSAKNTSSSSLYIAQQVLVIAGPPIYSAAEYNVLGRLMRYLPMHAPLHPDRVLYFFTYLGIAVESFTGNGASLYATASADDHDQLLTGGKLISTSLVLQGVVECLFIAMVALMQHRARKSKMDTVNVRRLCLMLYGTATLVIFRCIFRSIEAFGAYTATATICGSLCRWIVFHEWYLYAFEAAPMFVYTYWINFMHPGRFLPSDRNRYLDIDGKTERLGPGWVDKRSKWETFIDPFDLKGRRSGIPAHDSFWLRPEEWPVAPGGTFAAGSAENHSKK